MGQSIQEWTKWNLRKTAFKKLEDRPYPLECFKGCLPQILLGPFLNTLSYIPMSFIIAINLCFYVIQYWSKIGKFLNHLIFKLFLYCMLSVIPIWVNSNIKTKTNARRKTLAKTSTKYMQGITFASPLIHFWP